MLNKATLIGRVGRTPEVKFSKSGVSIASFSIATSERWKDKQGNKMEKSEWHNIVCFDKVADIVGKYVMKGGLVYVEGKIQTDKYTGKDGVEKYSTKIHCSNLQMLGSKGNDKHEEKEPEQEEEQGNTFTDDDVPF